MHKFALLSAGISFAFPCDLLSIETVRRGTKKERCIWFENLLNAVKEVRMAEVDEIFADH